VKEGAGALATGVVTGGPYRVTYLPVDREGLLNLADLEAAITDETAVVSLMWANNETGVLFPIERIAEICQSRGVLNYCDAVQAAGEFRGWRIDIGRLLPAFPVTPPYVRVRIRRFGGWSYQRTVNLGSPSESK
jgi:aspartate/methionine/tyrosine aminotransferase